MHHLNRLFAFFILFAASSILFPENLFTDLAESLINKGIDKALDETKEKIKSYDLDWDDFSFDAGISEKIGAAMHSKKTDPVWFETQEVAMKDAFEDSMSQFFQQFHSTNDPITPPLEIHFYGSNAALAAPLLDRIGPTIEIPSMSLADRPIDYTNGGLNTVKNMAKTLESCYTDKNPLYRHLVGLETTSPLMGSVAKQILTWANQLNAMSIQSYDIAAAFHSGMWPKIQRSKAYACEHELIAKGMDLLEARTLCQQKTTRDKVLQTLASRNPQIFAGHFNVADKVLSHMGIQKEKELLINLTGTLIAKPSEKMEYYPPLLNQVIALLQTGAPIKNGYRISEGGLRIERGPVPIKLKPQKELIFDLFKRIQQNLKDDTDFSADEKKLLGSSHFPIISLISLMTQCKKNGSILLLERYSNLIAFERAVQFIEEVVQNILYTANSLRAVQISGYELDAYIKQLQDVLENLEHLKIENYQKLENEQRALDSFVQIDRELRERLQTR